MAQYLRVFIPFLSFGLNIFGQIAAFKLLLKGRLLKSEYCGFIYGGSGLLIGEVIIYLLSPEKSFPLFIADIVIYCCLSYGYFNFINLGETARRVRLLRELYESPAGLTKDALFAAHSPENVVNKRLERLLNNKQIILKDGRYYIAKPAMLIISKAIVFLKVIVFGKRSEFEERGK